MEPGRTLSANEADGLCWGIRVASWYHIFNTLSDLKKILQKLSVDTDAFDKESP